jgi:hypothetical protein
MAVAQRSVAGTAALSAGGDGDAGAGTGDRLLALALSLSAGVVVVVFVAVGIYRRHHKQSLQDPDADDEEPVVFGVVFARRLAELTAFQARVGHADVPLDSSNAPSSGAATGLTPKGLGNWVYKQRRLYAERRLGSAEVAVLSGLGFRWELGVEELDWGDMLARLALYREAHGDAQVPKKFEADPLLGAWVAACRRRSDPMLNGGASTLSPEQTEKLNKAEFAWEPKKRCGSAFMRGLREFASAMADDSPPDEAWCRTQRRARRQGKLSDQRVSYLEKFGFDWEKD